MSLQRHHRSKEVMVRSAHTSLAGLHVCNLFILAYRPTSACMNGNAPPAVQSAFLLSSASSNKQACITQSVEHYCMLPFTASQWLTVFT
jgi:hypothetical protein